MKYPTASGAALQRAYSKAVKEMVNTRALNSTTVSAGFIIPDGQPGLKTGYQVFVKVARFSERLLKTQPDTGGLVENE